MTLDAIKEEIEHLSKGEQQDLLRWLDEREQAEWDAEIEHDFSPGGPGTALLEEMKADARAGKFRPFEEGRPSKRKS